jgi:hypothetical protein
MPHIFSTHPTFASVFAAVSGLFSVASVLEYIPDDIGKAGVLVSILLTVVLIYSHLRKDRREQVRFDRQMEDRDDGDDT